MTKNIQKKLLFILVSIIFSIPNLYSQEIYLKGVIQDSQEEALSYANIKIENLQNGLQMYCSSKEDGSFEINKIPQGKYLFEINYIGFENHRQDIEINKSIDLGLIMLKENSTLLNTVTVTANIPQITFRNNRYILNIENSSASTGRDANDLLKYAPGVWTDNSGNISINGLSGVTILMDGKEINLKGEALANYLKSIRSENIGKIEILPQASSEYEAQGLGGVINIISKQKKDIGLSVLTSLTLYKQKYQGMSPNISLNYNNDKFEFQMLVSGEYSKWLLKIDENRFDKNNHVFQSNNFDTIRDNHSTITANLFYKINDNHKLGFRFYNYFYNKKERMGGQSAYMDSLFTNSLQPERQKMNNISLTLNYTWLIDTLGKSLKVLTDYSDQYKYDIDDKYSYYTKSAKNTSFIENYQSLRERPYKIYSIKADYINPIRKHLSLRTGYKYSYSNISDMMNTDSLTNGIWKPLPERNYTFKYIENIHSAYASLNYNIKKTTIYWGLRVEYTNYRMSDISDSYWNLFPAISINQIINTHSFDLSYNKRIKRVSYFNLTPNFYYPTKYELVLGNPDLKPEIIHNIRFGYNFRNKYSFSLMYSHNKNKISQYVWTDESRILNTSFIDGGKENIFSANMYIPINFFSWWGSINQMSVYRTKFKNNQDRINNTYFDIYTSQFWTLPSNFKIELLYKYTSKSKYGYTTYEPYHLLNVTFQKPIKERINIKLDIQRMLYKQKQTVIVTNNSIKKIKDSFYSEIPFFSLTVSYTFNKNKKKSNRIETSNSDELQRIY